MKGEGRRRKRKEKRSEAEGRRKKEKCELMLESPRKGFRKRQKGKDILEDSESKTNDSCQGLFFSSSSSSCKLQVI